MNSTTFVVTMKILLVCTGNAYRSPVAEALLKKFRPEFEVDSAGTHPGIPIAASARNYVAGENAERYLKPTPERLDEKDLESYDLIITMEPQHKDVVLNQCPGCANKILVWNIEDPYFLLPEQGQQVFKQIKGKVERL